MAKMRGKGVWVVFEGLTGLNDLLRESSQVRRVRGL